MLFKINNFSNKQTLINSYAASNHCPISYFFPIFSLMNKNMYMLVLNFMSILLLVYNIVTYWKPFNFRAINYQLMCVHFIFFICLSSFVCVYIHIVSLSVFCPILLSQKKKHSKTNFHTTVNYHISILACILYVKNGEFPKEM